MGAYSIFTLTIFVYSSKKQHFIIMPMMAYFSKTLSNLIEVLEEEAGVLTWLKQDQMIANPEEFHALLIKRDQTNASGENFNIHGKTLKLEETVKFLGIHLDYKLSFEQHISELAEKLQHN